MRLNIRVLKTGVFLFSKDPLPSLSSVKRNEVDEMYILPALPQAEEEQKSRSDAQKAVLLFGFRNFSEQI